MKEKSLYSGFLSLGKYFPHVKFKINESKPVMIIVYQDKIELLVQTFNGKSLKTEVKKFDYKDLILMNETLNKIMKPDR